MNDVIHTRFGFVTVVLETPSDLTLDILPVWAEPHREEIGRKWVAALEGAGYGIGSAFVPERLLSESASLLKRIVEDKAIELRIEPSASQPR